MFIENRRPYEVYYQDVSGKSHPVYIGLDDWLAWHNFDEITREINGRTITGAVHIFVNNKRQKSTVSKGLRNG